MTTLRLTGHDLSIADVISVARGNVAVALDRAAEHRASQAAKVVAELAKGDAPVYGVNTGFGDLATVRVPHERLRELQRNLVRSHSVGLGDPLPADVVRAVLLLRANTLAAGRSGVRVATIQLVLDMLNNGVLPVIPAHGSVGASGDLAPLAHAALVLIGEGEAMVGDQRISGSEALRRKGLSPIELGPKEGVALINGTQVMSAIGCLALHDAEVLATTADIVGAMSAEALRATDVAWDAALNEARPHPGQLLVAANLRALMNGSPNVASHRTNDPRVQDPYSVRCMPQVHGASRDALAYTRRVLEIEINAVTDNPLVFAETARVTSGGNFHGQPVAIALDLATIAVAELADISEARIDRMTNGHTSGLPPFLTSEAGTNSGFMVAQYTAAALVTENRLRSFPASVESLPTSAGMEDHVSMGVHAAHKLTAVVRNTRDVLAIEALCAAQGLDLLGATTASGVEEARHVIRERVPALARDRVLAPDVVAIAEVIARERLLAAVRARLPDLS
ncbi:MAG: histidine ammonia-lyase [Chloroflexi bacterium]|nr:MAG: histidine ammonia-lyase [Chloroflexota bacterium]TMB96841.1 MAG: histidine ammonia-lyase [Chloroflexota bacterium]